jgi:chromate transporter
MKKSGINRLYRLFSTFFKIGLFTFGGGYAMIPLMQREIVDRHHWISRKRFIDIISLTQTVPGTVAVNLSIFFGYSLAGLPGAIVSALGVALPSFIIIILIATGFSFIKDYPYVEYAFRGIRPAVVGLILYAGVKLARGTNWSIQIFFLMLFVFIINTLLGVNPVYLIMLALLSGLLNYNFHPGEYKKETVDKHD